MTTDCRDRLEPLAQVLVCTRADGRCRGSNQRPPACKAAPTKTTSYDEGRRIPLVDTACRRSGEVVTRGVTDGFRRRLGHYRASGLGRGMRRLTVLAVTLLALGMIGGCGSDRGGDGPTRTRAAAPQSPATFGEFLLDVDGGNVERLVMTGNGKVKVIRRNGDRYEIGRYVVREDRRQYPPGLRSRRERLAPGMRIHPMPTSAVRQRN
jgi:hypothetical protein